MPISFATLWSDSTNFIRNTFGTMIILLIILTGINLILIAFVQSDIQFLAKFIEQLLPSTSSGQASLEQVQTKISQLPSDMLVQVTGSAFTILFAQLAKGLIGISLTFAFIHTVSMMSFSWNPFVSSTTHLLIKLSLSFLLLIPIFFVTFSLGALLGILGIFIIIAILLVAFALLPAILVINQHPLLASIRLSYQTGFAYIKLLLPLVAMYLMFSNLVGVIFSGLPKGLLTDALIIFISQAIYFFFALCCYRLFTMTSSPTTNQENQ